MSLHDVSASDLKLVDETALDKDFESLVTFEARKVNGDLRFTKEQLDRMNNHMLRKLAQYADTDEINGKSPAYSIKAYFRVQRSLKEYE
jgi:hypothetical protein